MKTLNLDEVTYAYSIQGRGDKAVLLHGFTGCGANWQEVVGWLGLHYQLILPDLLGHGESSAPADPQIYAMETAAAHLAALLDTISREPVHLLGYSMGGRLALYFALHYPSKLRSLVLESASPGLETASEQEKRRQEDELLAHKIEREGVPAFVDYWERLPLFASQVGLPEETRARLRTQRLSNRPAGLAASLRGMGTGAQPSLWSRLAELSLPVLLITGGRDEKFLVVNQRMVKLIPGAELAVIPGAGHTTHLERAEAFSQQVLKFWNRLAAGMGSPDP